MKTLAAALAIMASSAAASDIHYLSQHGDWVVALDATHGNMSCAAQTINNAEEIFDFTITQNGQMTMYIIFDGKPGLFQVNLDVVIEGVETWEMDNVNFTPYGAYFNFPDPVTALEFMIDVQRGKTLTIHKPRDQQAVTGWSLNGSKAAIDGMFECFRRISGVGA